MKTKISEYYQICISVPLNKIYSVYAKKYTFCYVNKSQNNRQANKK